MLALWNWWRSAAPVPESSPAAIYYRGLNKLLLCVAAGIGAIVLNAIRVKHWEDGLVARAVGFGILIAGAAFICGVLLGFLFGVPPVSDHAKGSSTGSPDQRQSPPPQTNLEEIADWLTKIILGAGLVQLTKLPHQIWMLSNFVASAIPEDYINNGKTPVPNAPIALAIMGYFSSCGLLYGYIWTRYNVTVSGGVWPMKTSGGMHAENLPPGTPNK